jgi:hypothetical protein
MKISMLVSAVFAAADELAAGALVAVPAEAAGALVAVAGVVEGAFVWANAGIAIKVVQRIAALMSFTEFAPSKVRSWGLIFHDSETETSCKSWQVISLSRNTVAPVPE